MRLSFVSKSWVNPEHTSLSVTLAVEYAPHGNIQRARLADVRVYANAIVEPSSIDVQPGPALGETAKQLFQDPVSQKTWKVRADKSIQVLILSLQNTNLIAAGRVATLSFNVTLPSDYPTPRRIPFKLVKRLQTLAPREADEALYSEQFDSALVVDADE